MMMTVVMVTMVTMVFLPKVMWACGGNVGVAVDVGVGVVGVPGGWRWRQVTAAWGGWRRSDASGRSDRSGALSGTQQGGRGMVMVEG